MSYEGYEEYLCVNGHYTDGGSWDEPRKECAFCKAPMAHCHSVDVTNGYDESLPGCCEGPKEQIGEDDDWRVDKYGTRYAIGIPKYRPGAGWYKR